jgi:hypothetical protein
MISYNYYWSGWIVFWIVRFHRKVVRNLDLVNVLHWFADLIVQRIADLSNTFAQIVDLACNLIRTWIVTSYSTAFSGSKFRQDHCRNGGFCFNLGGSANLYIPIHASPPPPPLFMSEKIVFVGKMLPLAPHPKTWNPRRPCSCVCYFSASMADKLLKRRDKICIKSF